MEKCGVLPNQTIVVENAPLGVQAGNAAKAFTIGANTGPLPENILKEAGADIVFPSILAVCDAWDELF